MVSRIICPCCKGRLFDISDKVKISIKPREGGLSEDLVIKCQKCGREIAVKVLGKTK